MRKIVLLAIATFLMVGCTERNPDGSIVLKSKFERSGDYYVEVIDSCEYICSNSRMAHKGNCKFCAERKHVLVHDTIWIQK